MNTIKLFKNVAKKLIFSALLATLLNPFHQAYSTALDVSTPRTAVPPNIITSSNKPMLMLATSKDHTLFGPIYTDFEDLDGDGTIETTFNPKFKYYGYFDATKCYSYSVANAQFEPKALATEVTGRQTCASATYWSGNFLNWSSMTRVDIVRKMLYGGKRSTDTNGSTVLERVGLNYDAHSFVKYYRGDDIADYTPFTKAALTKTTGSNANVYSGLTICNTGSADNAVNTPIMKIVKGNYRFWATVEINVCRWFDAPENYNLATFGPKLVAYYGDTDKGNGGINHEAIIPSKAIDGAIYTGITEPVLTVRVKACDPSFLGEERCQAFPPDSTTNYKPFGLFQEFGHNVAGGAARAEFGVISGSYDKNYTGGALRKNMGDFADEINSTTGVFCHNASSGCPATLPSPDSRATGDGAIKSLDGLRLLGRANSNYGASGSPATVAEGALPIWGNPVGEMVVQALQYYAAGTASNPGTTTKDVSAGQAVQTWKDPLSNANTERRALYGNAVCRPMNILALSSSAMTFDANAGALPNTATTVNTFTDTIGTQEGLSNTLRSVGSVSGSASFGTSCSAKLVGNLSDVSGICPESPAMGGTYQVAGAALYGNTNRIRTITNPPSDLNTVQGVLKVRTLAASLTGGVPRVDVPVPGKPGKFVYITPESTLSAGGAAAPLTFASISSGINKDANGKPDGTGYGSFIVTWNDLLMGGDYDMDVTGYLRYDTLLDPTDSTKYNIKITTDIPGVCGGAGETHGFSIVGVNHTAGGVLASTVAGIDADGRYLTHQHIGGATTRSNFTGMTASEYLCGNTTYRAKNTGFGTFETTVCSVTGTKIGTTSKAYINGVNGAQLESYCTVKPTAYPVTLTFQIKADGAGEALIKDPLWYAAKYGSFDIKTTKKTASGAFDEPLLPPDTASWDKTKADGSLGSDGIPDGYFLARRPELLEQQLRRALDDVARASSAAPAVSSSQLTDGSYKYVAKFDSSEISGDIEAFKVKEGGSFDILPNWNAAQLLTVRTRGTSGTAGDKGDSRVIITNTGNASSTGVKFRWDSTALGSFFGTLPYKLKDANKEILVNYLRGDYTHEGSTKLRERKDNILGPVVNATPWIQTPPNASYAGSKFDGYGAFAKRHNQSYDSTAKKIVPGRKKVLWVSANDGMLHAFDSESGEEIFAYVPGSVGNRLAEIPMQRTGGRTRLNGANFNDNVLEILPLGTVWPYVDGNPFSGDVKVGSDWRTYVFGTLGRGGKGVFALDATNIDSIPSGGPSGDAKLTEAEVGSKAQNIFKWQFTSDDDADLGYVTSEFSFSPASKQATPIAKLNNGKFAIILGNGYKSTTGKASLFLLYVDGPAGTGSWTGKYKKIIADDGKKDATGASINDPNYNGLSAANWIDSDGDGVADTVYAGDLRGNMWKFDISDIDDTKWDVAYKDSTTKKPLFIAKSGTTLLPISTAPEYAYPAFPGLIVTFGTGNAFESLDFPNKTANQRIYGVLDRPSFKTQAGELIPAAGSTLVEQTYQRLATGNVIVTNSSSIDWQGATTRKDGWFFKLPGESEMVLSDPDIKAGVLTFTTVRPKTGTDLCSSTPDASLFTIDPISGVNERNIQGTLEISGVVTNIAGTVIADQRIKNVVDNTGLPFKDNCTTSASGVKTCPDPCTEVAGVKTCSPQYCSGGQRSVRAIGQGTNANWCYTPGARTQWREIPGLRTDQ
jgi:type IV pilus assembly protein PilY1